MRPPPRFVSLSVDAALGALVGVVAGSASALFLVLLDRATALREGHRSLVFALPLAGLVLGTLLGRFGAAIKGGSGLVIDRIESGGPELPGRMAPMVLVGTTITHLFGGSAGREGAAVQMGAGLADAIAHRVGASVELRRSLLVAGVAGGFGSVFGTPLAGAVFALEFSTPGRVTYASLIPALAASVVGDLTTRAWGVRHTHYPAAPHVALTPSLALRWLVFAAAVAAVATAFIELTHLLKREAERRIPAAGPRMMLGGAAVVGLWQLTGTDDYLGLGVPVIVRAFEDPQLPLYAFAAKLLFTSVTLGAGFPGGEVTPLFLIGAALGNALSRALDIPLALGAGVGMAAVFGAASRAPLALSIMAVELVGASIFPHAAIVCVVAYALVGGRTIYSARRS